MKDNTDKEMSELLGVPSSQSDAGGRRVDAAIRRIRASVGQRDSLMFALVKFWTVIAELAAPLFAQLARRHAQARHGARPNPLPQAQSAAPVQPPEEK